MQHELTRRLDLGRHLRQSKCYRLVPYDWLTEGLALLGIGQRKFVGRTCHPHRLCRDADTTAFQIGERNAISLTLRTEPVPDRDLEILETNLASVRGVLPHFALNPADPVARPGRLDNEGRDTPLAA